MNILQPAVFGIGPIQFEGAPSDITEIAVTGLYYRQRPKPVLSVPDVRPLGMGDVFTGSGTQRHSWTAYVRSPTTYNSRCHVVLGARYSARRLERLLTRGQKLPYH